MEVHIGVCAVIEYNRRRQPIHYQPCPILYVSGGNSHVACYVLVGTVSPCGLVL